MEQIGSFGRGPDADFDSYPFRPDENLYFQYFYVVRG